MLVELKKVARNVKSCSKVAEHNRAMPSGRHVCDFSSLTDEGIGGQSPDILNRAHSDLGSRALCIRQQSMSPISMRCAQGFY